MMRSASWLPAVATSLALVAGCTAMPAAPGPAGGFALAPAEGLRALAEPTAFQWSTQLVNNPEIQRRRTAFKDEMQARRSLQNVVQSWDEDLTDGLYGTTVVTGKISSAPCYFYGTGEAFWVTDTGWLLKYNVGTGAKTAWRVSTTDTFPNTSVTLSFNGNRAYLVSAQGKLHVVSTVTGAHATGSPLSLGGTNANVTFGTPVFVDPLASRPDSTFEMVYAMTASGQLKRIASTSTGSGNAITLAQTYTLPTASNDIVRTSPVVLGGKAVVTTWRRSTAATYNHADDQGAVIYYDTKCTTPTAAATTGFGQVIAPVVLEAPLWAPPAVEVDNALTPILAFVPAGNGVAMVDLGAGRSARSVPLVVDSATTATTGNLASYTYSAASSTLAAKYPVTSGVATISGAGTLGTAQVYGAKQVSTTNTNQVYGYLRYTLADSELTTSNVLKAVFNARLDLRCNASSNAAGMYNPLAPRIFRVHNQLTLGTGANWLSTNLAYSTRPPHMDGTAFDQTAGTLSARTSWELTRTGTSVFASGADYAWNAKGKIGQPGQDYSFGFTHTQLHESPSLYAGLLSQPAPRFLGGSTDTNRPRLYLTVSTAGMANPTISAPVTIDSLYQQVYAVNTNALFKLSYVNAATNWVQGAANFSEDDQTRFALTSLGSDGTNAGPLHTSSTRFVENPSAPLFDGTYVYVHANHPGYTRSSITRFVGGTATATPSVSGTPLLLATNSGGAAPFMSFDYASNRLFLATFNTTTSAGKAWMVTRY